MFKTIILLNNLYKKLENQNIILINNNLEKIRFCENKAEHKS